MRLLVVEASRFDHRPRLHRRRRGKSQQYPSCVGFLLHSDAPMQELQELRMRRTYLALEHPYRASRATPMPIRCSRGRACPGASHCDRPKRHSSRGRRDLCTPPRRRRKRRSNSRVYFKLLLVSYMPLANFLGRRYTSERRGGKFTQAQRLGPAEVLQTTRRGEPFAQRTPRAAPVTARGPLRSAA